MATALINPKVLQWARVREGSTVSDLAERGKWSSDRVAAWEEGATQPTFNQAKKLAKLLQVPFGFFFLERPPESRFELPDFRTVGDRAPEPSLELREVVKQARLRQDWLSDYRREEGLQPSPIVRCTNLSEPPQEVAQRLLGMMDEAGLRGSSGVLTKAIIAIEATGVCVMRQSVVGNNTRRPLDVEEFRGFALVDEYAPFVFVNARDIEPAQLFTTIHELVHIALGESGVSNLEFTTTAKDTLGSEEKFCNQVAAELLVPEKEMLQQYASKASVLENAARLSKNFAVSYSMVARRAFELGLIAPGEYWQFIKERRALAISKRQKQKEGDGGPSFLTLVPGKHSASLTSSVLQAVGSGDILIRDAARLLNVRPRHIDDLLGVAGRK